MWIGIAKIANKLVINNEYKSQRSLTSIGGVGTSVNEVTNPTTIIIEIPTAEIAILENRLNKKVGIYIQKDFLFLFFS